MTVTQDPPVETKGEEAVEDGTGLPSKPIAEQTPAELFKFSKYIHVGPGAEECDGIKCNEDGDTIEVVCEDDTHFHAWCRLPNPLQQSDIREKAQAAKARKMRALRNPEADSHVILEGELEEIAATGDTETIIDELLERDDRQELIESMQEVNEREEFAHYEQDREEYQRLRALPEEERPQEEYEQLQSHLAEYAKAVSEEVDKRLKPKRDALESKTMDELIDLIRTQRVEGAGVDVFMHTYALWTWYVGTLVPVKGPGRRHVQRMWRDMAQMRAEAPEVIDELKSTFEELEHSFIRSRGELKNS